MMSQCAESSDARSIRRRPVRTRFAFPARCDFQPLSGPDGEAGGAIERRQWAVEGEIEWSAPRIAEGLFKLTVRILNCTPYARADGGDRDEALMRALVSTHAILGVQEGEFISLLDPPESCREAAAGCRNVGLWPVLVGEEGATDALLASPIILYDYPQIAPESPGDLFDGTEIDEILTLRILTLTDAEKREMIAGDERARALLARTEAMGPEELMRLHGTMRGLRPLSEGESRE